jgi:drug/metabolite transporter (DMT)-like permease
MIAPTRGEASRLGIVAAFAAVYVIWGSTYLAIRIAIETIPPLLMAGLRHAIGGAVLYVLVRYGIGLTAAPRPQRVHWRSAAIIGTLLLFVGNGGVSWAEQTVPSGLAALFVTTVPVWLVLLGWARRDGARPGLVDVVGVLLGFSGVAVLVAGNGLLGGQAVDPIGATVLVLASLAWAGGSLYSRRAPLPQSLLLATAMQMLCGGIVLLVVGLAIGEWGRVSLGAVSWRSLVALAYLIAFGSWVAFSAYVWLLRVTTPARVGTYAFVNPVVAVLLGYLLADEALGPRTVLAAVVIVTAVVLITLYGKRAPQNPPVVAGSSERISKAGTEPRHASLGHASRCCESERRLQTCEAS